MSESKDTVPPFGQWLVVGRSVQRASVAVESISVAHNPAGIFLVLERPGQPVERIDLSSEAARHLGTLLMEA